MPEERYNLLKQIDMVYNEDKDLNANTNNKFKQIEKQKLKEIKDMQNNFEENDTIQNTNIEFKDDDILKSKLFNEEDFIKKM